MRPLRFLVLLCLITAPLRAQVILGTVTDSLTGAPIVGATLSLQDSTGARIWQTQSDTSGAFRLDGTGAPWVRFEVRKIGTRPSLSPVFAMPAAADTVQVDLSVPVVGVTLATVTVVASSKWRDTFNRRQLANAVESGWYVVEPYIIAEERGQASSFSQLLRRSPLPGVRAPRSAGDCFTNTRNRRCLTIVVDGLLLDPYAFINPRDVHFVAYIPANSAQILYGARAREGAIFIATRRPGDDERRP